MPFARAAGIPVAGASGSDFGSRSKSMSSAGNYRRQSLASLKIAMMMATSRDESGDFRRKSVFVVACLETMSDGRSGGVRCDFVGRCRLLVLGLVARFAAADVLVPASPDSTLAVGIIGSAENVAVEPKIRVSLHGVAPKSDHTKNHRSGTAEAVPEPSAFVYGGVICAGIALWALRQQRRREAGLA